MRDKAPFQIYISEDSARRLLPSNGISVGLKPLFADDICYMLESEHNRIVEQLTKEKESLLKALLKAQKRREDTTIGKL